MLNLLQKISKKDQSFGYSRISNLFQNKIKIIFKLRKIKEKIVKYKLYDESWKW